MQNNLTTFDRNKFIPYSIGFDNLFDRLFDIDLESSGTYPPYNIEQISQNSLRITVAVAGFKKNELDVSLEGNQLQIRGNKKEDERERIFIHRGIATRQFQRNFVLADGIEVKEASMDDGLLFVDLTQPINNDQSVKIEIKDTKKKKKANLISLGNEHNNT